MNPFLVFREDPSEHRLEISVLRYFLAQAVSQDILRRGRGSRICWEGQAEVFSD